MPNEKSIKTIQAQAETNEAVLSFILNKIPGHVFWMDQDGNFIGCNDQQAISSGFKNKDELIGKNIADIFSKKEAKALQSKNIEIMKSREEQVIEEPGTYTDGKRKIYLSFKSPLINKENNVIGVCGFAMDITEHKRAEALQKELEFEQRANAMLKLWSSAIAHEMRTPLLALKTNASTLMTLLLSLENDNTEAFKTGRSKRKLAHLKEVPLKLEKTIQHANHFIDMTLAKSRAGNSNVAMNLKPLSIHNEVADALAKYPLKEEDRNLIHIDTKSDFTFMGESDYFHHIIFNLLKNAIHYIKKTDKGEIFIESRSGQKENLLIFKDTGTGMSKENLSQLFKPFFTKTKHGTGVGLSLCKNLMEDFGGSISCDSVEGEFTEFTLVFPTVISD